MAECRRPGRDTKYALDPLQPDPGHDLKRTRNGHFKNEHNSELRPRLHYGTSHNLGVQECLFYCAPCEHVRPGCVSINNKLGVRLSFPPAGTTGGREGTVRRPRPPAAGCAPSSCGPGASAEAPPRGSSRGPRPACCLRRSRSAGPPSHCHTFDKHPQSSCM